MTHLLHLDASARPGLAGKDEHGSHSRNLTHRFVSQWAARRAQDSIVYRDIGQNPPSFISHDWIDQIVRPGRTVEVDESKLPDPYVPLLADRPRHAVILSARGGIGFGPGGEMAHMNHLEPNLVTALNFIGITRIHQIAIEGQETGGEVLAASVAEALREVDALVTELQASLDTPPLHARARQAEFDQV